MDKWKLIIDHIFKFRIGDTDEKGGCTFIGGEWKDVSTKELFGGKKVVIFSLPGAFTPTCSGEQLPTYDEMYSQFKDKGIDDVYCVSVNDAFVMNAWARDLEIKNVTLTFGGVNAITDISFNVMEGEICAVIGPNGAGKSSMLNVINGIYLPQEGSVTYNGNVITKIKPRDAAISGMARTFQNIALFQGMTVLDNIMTGRNLFMKSTWLEQGLNIGRAKKEEVENYLLSNKLRKIL